jgi:hypothetical protein
MLLVTHGAWGQITVQTDARSIHETDNIEIHVQATGINLEAPDFSPIERDFEILSSRSNSQYRSVNGRVDAWTRWTLTAKPKRTGRLTIPALELDGHRSQPVTVTVKPLNAEVRAAIDALVFFELEVTPEPVYVQAQLLFVRRLFYADGTQLYGDMPAPPEISDAIVETLGQASSTTATREGRRYGVIEQHYAVFPERSGTITIPAAAVSGSVRLPPEFGMRRRTGVRVQSEVLQIRVLPIPTGYPASAPWLPARRVEIIEAWDAGPELVLGTPVERTLIVRAEGTVASMIPPLDVALPDSIRGYPDPPVLRDSHVTEGDERAGGLVGTRTESMSLVPGRPGPQRLPPVTLTWFDTDSEVVREAHIGARSVRVGDQAVAIRDALEAPEPLESTDQPVQPSAANITPHIPRPDGAFASSELLTMLLVVAVIGWGYTGWRLRQSRRPSATASSTAAAVLKDRTERATFRALQSACRPNAKTLDARTMKAALVDWASAYYRSPPDRALAKLNGADPESATIIDGLNARLYAAHPQHPVAAPEVTALAPEVAALAPEVAALAAAVIALATRVRSFDSTTNAEPLGPLYPSTS